MLAWVFAVSFLGVWVAWYLRPALIVDSPLRFPAGIATLETLNDVFGEGREAARRIATLAGAALLAGGIKAWGDLTGAVTAWAPSAGLKKLTLGIEPSFLLAGFGAIIGLRVGLSLALGALIAWAGLAPWLLDTGRVEATSGSGSLFGPLVEWLLWPGVSLMVTATLALFAVRLLRLGRARRDVSRPAGRRRPAIGPVLGFALASGLVVALQMWLFDISLALALVAIPFAVLLASVAARVVGETGIPPIGAIGKVSQLGFGVLAPGQAVTNLMTANIAGGAAGQAADLLNDFKVGHALGTAPIRQAVAQCLGILTGSIAGVAVYLALIPDPQAMLLTETWPAPAVATWKAVAEVMSTGLETVPISARWAMAAAAGLGLLLGLAEALLPASAARWLPSSAGLGLAFVIPASISFTMCLGALTAWAVALWRPGFAARYTVAAAAGLVAGESITGVVGSLMSLWGGG
jgi:uncharacterized oligopeptide transporter (OPT) family protein